RPSSSSAASGEKRLHGPHRSMTVMMLARQVRASSRCRYGGRRGRGGRLIVPKKRRAPPPPPGRVGGRTRERTRAHGPGAGGEACRGRDARATPGRPGQEHPPAGRPAPGLRSSSGEGRVVTAATGQAVAPPVTRQRGFWVLMGYAVVLGVFGAFAALIFVGAI